MDTMQSELWAMAPAIAEALGDEWTLRSTERDDNNVWPHFEAEGERVVYLTCWGYNNGKVEVHGDYPVEKGRHLLPYDAKRPEIGVTLKRGPEVIAREIKRRFLPAYDELLTQSLAMRDSHDAFRNLTKATVKALEDGMGRKLGTLDDSHERFQWRIFENDVHGDVTVSGDHVEIHVHGVTPLNAVLALKMILNEGGK